MTLFALLGLIPSIFGMVSGAPEAPAEVRRVIIRDEIILRVPIRPRLTPSIEWDEHKGPKCLPIGAIAGAMLSGPSSIDFVLRNRSRVRAKMDNDCPALDFYGEFYLQPDDDRICSKRETINSRVGTSCRIERFRVLVPKVKR